MCMDALSFTCAECDDHLVDNLCLAISLEMEGYELNEFGVQHRLETGSKCLEEPVVPI